MDVPVSTTAGGEIPAAPIFASKSPLQPPIPPVEAAQPGDGSANVGDATQEPADGDCATPGDQGAEPFQLLTKELNSLTGKERDVEYWHFLKCNIPGRLVEMETRDFICQIVEKFGSDVLIEAGLCEQVGDELRLAESFDSEADLFLNIDTQNCKVSFCQRLGPSDLPQTALDFARERAPAGSIRVPTIVYVAETDDDVDALRQIGLPAVSAAGLERFGRDEVIELFPNRDQRERCWRYHLVLLKFDVARMTNEPPPLIATIIERLADAEDAYGIDPSARFAVCSPTASELHSFEMTTIFKDSDRIREIFENWSVAALSTPVTSWRDYLDRPRVSLPCARAALIRGLDISHFHVRKHQLSLALKSYRQSMTSILEKLYTECDSARDPLEQLESYVAGGFAEKLLCADPLVRKAEAAIANEASPLERELQEEFARECREVMAELRHIRRGRNSRR